MERRRGELMHQCLPISCMKLLNQYLLVIAEGPCLLLSHPKTKFGEKYKRFQLFPNQLTITGIEFIQDSCGYPSANSVWDGPDENHSIAFVWAGNHGIFVTLNRTTCEISTSDTFPNNQDKVLSLDYIPIAARWFQDGKVLAILSVFNYVVVYERNSEEDSVLKLKQIAKYECEPENLYSGVMDGEELDKLLVFSGTTFKGILVWEIEDGKVIIRHTLTGHQGIPFSLEYNRDWQMLLSASDDRSVIVWAFTDKENEKRPNSIFAPIMDIDDETKPTKRNQKLPSIVKITHMMTGHDSRVWKAIWVKHAGFSFIVSVGEDSYVRMGSYDLTTSKCWKAHDGAPIYQCAYDPMDDFLYTAAHDGSVFRWKRFYLRTDPVLLPFDQIEKHPWTAAMNKVNEHGRSLINKDYPRGVVLYNTNYVIACMNSGRIIAFYYYNKKQFSLYYDENLKTFAVLSVSRQRNALAIGGMDGHFVLLKLALEDKPYSPNISCLFADFLWSYKFESKILNIIWLADDENNRVLIACLDKAFLFRFVYEDEEKTKFVGECLQTFTFKQERPGVPCAILTESGYIVAGDEIGSLLVFRVDIAEDNLVLEMKDVHTEGVTSIVEHKGKILTAGRFGGVKSFNLEIEGSEVKLVQVHEFIPPFEWVGVLLPLIKDDDLLVGGFLKSSFIIYSWKDKRILNEINGVGGGHRRWDLKVGQGNVAFSYIRDKEIWFSTTSIEDRKDNILKPGLHCKTINCGISLQKKDESLYIATGSEDGSIRVFRFDFIMNKYYPLHRINSHSSGVRTLTCLDIDEDHTMLFSGGGRSEVFVFLIGIGVEELTMLGKVTVVKPKLRATEIDTRIMDISVIKLKNKDGEDNVICFCACSDGIVRVLIYSHKTKKVQVVTALHGNGHAVLKTQFIKLKDYILVFGVTSNGFVISWKWENTENQEIPYKSEPKVVESIFSKQLRKAAVMSFRISLHSKPFEYKIVLGSDDCCISLWKLAITQDESDSILLEPIWSQDQAQRGAVVGVEICDDFIYSCSNDQVIARWDLNGALKGTVLCGVPDCQGFIVKTSDDSITCFGDGITWITCP